MMRPLLSAAFAAVFSLLAASPARAAGNVAPPQPLPKAPKAAPMDKPEPSVPSPDPVPKPGAPGIASPDTTKASMDASLILKAMGSELKRSMDSLRMRGSPRPYFLSYLIWDVGSWRMQASLGSCDFASWEDQHLLEVDLRVGDYKQDNSNFQGGIVFGPRLRLPLPQENDTNLLKQSLWAATDAKYKVALEQLAQKKAFLENQASRDTLPDNSRQKVLVQRQAEPKTPPDTGKVIALGRELSRYLGRYGWLLESRVGYQYYYSTHYYTDSEGSRYIQSVREHTLLVSLFTQAKDGTPLWDYLRVATRDPLGVGEAEGPASLKALKAAVDSLAARLDYLRKAEPMTSYRGPVLFAGTSAGELLNKSLLAPQSRLREPLGLGAEPNFMVSMAGRKLFPSSITVTDRPSQRDWEGRSLFGHYLFDHQGQPAKDITLVADGRLKDYYLGKVPVFKAKGHEGNGHWRYGGGFPGVVALTSSATIPEADLRKRLAAMGAEEGNGYGLLVSKPLDEDAFKLLRHPLAVNLLSMDGGDGRGTFTLAAPCEMDLLDSKTGKLTPVRGLSFPAIDSKSLRDIVAVGDRPVLYEPQAAFSVLCPPLLFSLLDLKGNRATQPRLPYLP